MYTLTIKSIYHWPFCKKNVGKCYHIKTLGSVLTTRHRIPYWDHVQQFVWSTLWITLFYGGFCFCFFIVFRNEAICFIDVFFLCVDGTANTSFHWVSNVSRCFFSNEAIHLFDRRALCVGGEADTSFQRGNNIACPPVNLHVWLHIFFEKIFFVYICEAHIPCAKVNRPNFVKKIVKYN